MTAHRYWGIRIDAIASGSIAITYEFEMRGVPGGPDLCTGGTPYASSNQFLAFELTDDNLTTAWQSNGSPMPQRVWYDFGTPVEIAQIKIYMSDILDDVATDFAFEYSDNGINWVEIDSYTGYVWDTLESGLYTAVFDIPQEYRFDFPVNIPLLDYDYARYDFPCDIPLTQSQRYDFLVNIPLLAGQQMRFDFNVNIPLLSGSVVVDVHVPDVPVFGSY